MFLFNVLKWGGAAYLIYMGVQALRSPGTELAAVPEGTEASVPRSSSAFVRGFVTNLLNPKATLFFLALFTQMIDPAMPLAVRIGYAASFMTTAFVWFSVVALVMGSPRIRRGYGRLSRTLDQVCGGFFIALGLRLAAVRL